MSSYDRYDSRRRRPLHGPTSSRRSTFGYWVPLVLTITVATAGLVAWVWSERIDGDDDESESDDNGRPDHRPRPPREAAYPQPGYNGPTPGQDSYQGPQPGGFGAPQYTGPSGTDGSRGTTQDETFVSRMSGAIRRTPSPQQFFDSAGRQLAAGMAAAGAAVGLGSIREEEQAKSDRDQIKSKEREGGFSDHERWSEETVSRRAEGTRSSDATRAGPSGKSRSKKTVAVVVNADILNHSLHNDPDLDYRTEHASILSHLPQHLDPSTTNLFVLIYAPHLTTLPRPPSSTTRPLSTLSSYSNISTPAQTPGSELGQPDLSNPSTTNPPNATFDALYTQALPLVTKSSMILPFTTPTGYIHMLRHLSPSLVYLSDGPVISGAAGENVAQLNGWVGQVVVVVGDEGHGGLADTETETEDEGQGERTGGQEWWANSGMVGLGKGVEVVDAGRVGDDWSKRVGGRE